MKNKFLLLLCCFSLVACAQRMDDDDAGDDDGQHQPDPDPDPTPDPDPAECDSASDCLDNVGCNVGVCRSGSCSYESTCSSGQVCNVQTDVCESPTQPTTHGISCFETGGTLYLTISGQLTDSVYGGSLAHPKFISVASDQIANSWIVNASTTAPKVVLTDAERNSGYVTSASINLPSSQAQRFTLMVWSDDSGGYARRFDLGDWTVSGDGCARIDDGAPEGSTDGYVIGRSPLCANACDDGNASTTDVCSATGCIHEGGGGTTNPAYGTLNCSESGSNTTVTVTGPIVANVFNNVGLVPNTSATVRFGYGGSDSRTWVSDTSTYTLSMPNTVTGFNLKLLDQNGVEHWFNVNQFNVSGTCAKGVNEFSHTPGSGGGTGLGTLNCSESGSNTNVTVTGPIVANVFNNAGLSPNSSATIRFGYGGTDSRTWVSDSATYTLSMPNTTSGFNLKLLDQNGVEHWFDVNRFNVTGSCWKGTNEFGHSPGSGGGTNNGSVYCSESGSNTTVTISNGVLNHLFTTGLSPNSSWSIRFGSGADSRQWISDSSTYTLTMPSSTTGFNFSLRDPSNNDYWFDVNEFDVYGTCARGTNEFRHTATSSSDGYGHITCSVSGPDMTVTINGILNHTVSGTINPTSSWKIQYGSPQDGWVVPYPSGVNKPQLSWLNNTVTYSMTMSASVNGFNFALTDGVNAYWLDLNEYTVSGCTISGGALHH